MSRYTLSHLADATLRRSLPASATRERGETATVLAEMAEFDARKLYLPEAYPSMCVYCVGELRLTEDVALKRIRAARTAREYPALFDALAEGGLHVSSILLLTPYLRPQNANELIAEATRKSKPEIEAMLARRFPKSDVLPLVTPVSCQVAPGPVGTAQVADGPPCAPGRAESVALSHATPLSPDSYAIQCTVSRRTHERMGYLQSLLSHGVGSGDLDALLAYAVEAGIEKAEKRKLGATDSPRKSRPCRSERTIPAHVRREVWERDGGRCTFVSESGRRCDERSRLEFDHVTEVARGGRASVGQIRLRCRAHNQFTAEQAFGAEFMREKRRVAVESRVEERTDENDVRPWLRRLGFTAAEARSAARQCDELAGASLETRLRAALACLAPATRSPW